MAADLEGGERESCDDYFSCGVTDAVAKRGNCGFEGGEEGRQPGEEETKCCDEGELNHREGCGVGKGIEDGF